MANSADFPRSEPLEGASSTRALTAPPITSPGGVIPWKPTGRTRPEILTKGPTPGSLFSSFRRRWLLAFVLGLITAAIVVALVWVYLPAKYEASALLRVSSVSPFLIYPTGDAQTEFELYKRTQMQLIRSRPVLEAALRDKGIGNNPYFKGILDPVPYLANQLVVENLATSEILRISLKGDQKKELAPVVNGVVDAYFDEIINKELADRRKRRDDLEKRYQQYLEQIKEKTSEIHILGLASGTTDTVTGRLKQSLALKALDAFNIQQGELQRQLTGVEDELEYLTKISENVVSIPGDLLDLQTEQDPRLAEIDRQISGVQKELAELESRLPRPKSNPTYLRKTQELESIKSKKDEVRRSVREDLIRKIKLGGGNNVKAGRSKEELAILQQRLNTRLEKAKKDYLDQLNLVNKMDVINTDLESRNAELVHVRQIATDLGMQLERTNVEANNVIPRVYKYEPAKDPSEPDLKAKYAAMVFAGLIAFGLVGLGVSRMEFESRRLSNAGEATHELGLKHVGDIPAVSGLRWGRLLAFKGQSADALHDAMAESIDSVRAALVHHAEKIQGTPVLMVTSAAEREGKSTIASRLAVSLANSGRRTLLIDGHLREPQVHRTFNLPDEPGICDLLRDPEQLPQAVVRDTEIPGLSILSAGQWDESSMLAMARGGLHSIIEGLGTHYQFIVIDGAPVLTVSDSLAFGEEANLALLSVRRDVSRIPRVYEACERLKAVGIDVMGVVVNGVSS